MISDAAGIRTALFIMLAREKVTATVFDQAQETVATAQLKELFKELELSARNHHGWLYDCLKEKTEKSTAQWIKNLLWLEVENHDMYNTLMAQIIDQPIRQLFKELRDTKMRSITLLQQELLQQKDKH